MIQSTNELKGRLIHTRELAGYKSRKVFSEAIGVPYRTISNYETGEREPGHSYIVKLADFCHVTTDYILGLTDDPHGFFTVQVADTDPQIDRINRYVKVLNAQGLEKLGDYAEDLSRIPDYQKKKSPVSAKTDTGERGRLVAKGGVVVEQEHPADIDAFLKAIDESDPPETV